MLAVQVELLTGLYVATRFNDRSRVEWPPHPGRLFSAAVAAWADADEHDDDERQALLWWEGLGPPEIACSWDGEWSERAPVTHFVPVNDTQVLARDMSATYVRLRAAQESAAAAVHEDGAPTRDAEALGKALAKVRAKAIEDSTRAASSGVATASALGILPEGRFRQARQYPTAVPSDDRVTYQWPDADGGVAHAATLDAVLARIARLGHSSSLVSVSLTNDVIEPNLVPDERGDLGLRVASSGQLAALQVAFAGHGGTEPRILPARIATYRRREPASRAVPSPVFDREWLLLELLERRKVGIRDALPLARAVRGALIHHGPQGPVPEVISGHAAGPIGAPTSATDRPHLAVVALPSVAHPHADGLVRAVALVLPRNLDSFERDQVEFALDGWIAEGGGQLRLGQRGVVGVRRLVTDEAPRSAQPGGWCRVALRWATVTPIALDRNPGNLADRDPTRRLAAERAAEAIVASACTNIGLPAPVAVAIHTDPCVTGSAPVRSFPGYAVQGGRLRRVLVHAVVTFGEEVAGPLVLGAGRFLGYGLCVPLPVGEGSESD